jgi:uncharacterized protein
MAISMYQASVPVFTRMLTNLGNLLDKGAKHAEAKKIEPGVLITARLYPDMFPLARQVQIASDHAKGCTARLAGQEPPAYEDKEASFLQLLDRVNRTIEFIGGFTPEQIDASEEREIVLQMRAGPLKLKGQQYLLNVAMPNFYFHVSTAYGILRHNGVEVGKRDFLGAP